MVKPRIDQKLVELGLSPSRSKAKEMLTSGHVEVWLKGKWVEVTEPAFSATELNKNSIRIKSPELLKYVSRGGLKLEAALKYVHLNPDGLTCLDIGQSTGGFTDCLLQHKARSVVGVDVGQDQLHSRLREDARVLVFEGVNVRTMNEHGQLKAMKGRFDLVVADLSFISLTFAIPAIKEFITKEGKLLLLVKPQFELDRSRLNKHGIVKSEDSFPLVKKKLTDEMLASKLKMLDYFESSPRGQDGNREFFIYASC